MSISQAAVWEVRADATANNVNGGFFVTGATGTDYSQQTAAQYALTGIASAGAGNTILSASAAAAMVGNGANVVSGTNFTTGWFEVTSVSVGVSITFSTNVAGASICTGVGANGVINIGGAMSLNSTLDDDMFEAAAVGGGNIFYLRGSAGTLTLGEAVAISLAGGTQKPHQIVGYNSTRGDNPTGSTRPIITCGAVVLTLGTNWDLSFTSVNGTSSTVVTPGTSSKLQFSKVINKSATTGRDAIQPTTSGALIGCEIISYRGNGINQQSSAALVSGCYIHDCNVGITGTSSAPANIQFTIIESCVTAAIQTTGAQSIRTTVNCCTLFGSTNTTGIGVSLATGSTNFTIINSIIAGFVTGVSHADTQTIGYDDYNCYSNNDADVSAVGQWQKGSHDVTTAPAFTSVTQVTGATATTTTGNHIVQAGATFVTSGVTAGRDYVYVVSGTGVTAGIYGIASVDSETQITTDIAITANATADKVFQITVGRNFLPTGAI